MDAPTYLRDLRRRSAYPFFRSVASFMMWVLLAAALLVFASGVYVSQNLGKAWPVIASSIVGGLIAVIAFASQEASLMLADLADATIDTAASKRSTDDASDDSP